MNSCAILAGVFITLGWFTKSIRSPGNIFYRYVQIYQIEIKSHARLNPMC